MDARDATAHNADLWSTYLADQWRAWLDPFGLAASPEVTKQIADAAGATIARFVDTLIQPAVRSMYESNAPALTRFLDEQAIQPEAFDTPPDEFRRPPTRREPTPMYVMSRPRELVGAL
jgi:hypothetical protein